MESSWGDAKEEENCRCARSGPLVISQFSVNYFRPELCDHGCGIFLGPTRLPCTLVQQGLHIETEGPTELATQHRHPIGREKLEIVGCLGQDYHEWLPHATEIGVTVFQTWRESGALAPLASILFTNLKMATMIDRFFVTAESRVHRRGKLESRSIQASLLHGYRLAGLEDLPVSVDGRRKAGIRGALIGRR